MTEPRRSWRRHQAPVSLLLALFMVVGAGLVVVLVLLADLL